MKIKSYFAGSVEAAIADARSEFGPDAMLMNSRKAPLESRHLGEYEVVVACASDAEVPKHHAEAAGSREAADSDNLHKEISALRRELERLAAGARRATLCTDLLTEPVAANLFSKLLAAEMDPGLANSVLSAVRSRQQRDGARDLTGSLIAEVQSLCASDASLGQPNANKIVALVGPPGAGKTTNLIKLAVRYGVSARKPTQFLTLDTERISAADQLHTFAEILGCGFKAMESTHALSQAIEEHRTKHLILIDTPGIGARDTEALESLISFFGRREDIDIHVVLPVFMKPADLTATLDRFGQLGSSKLFFTHLDATRTYGAILNESFRSGKPVSFLSTGQQIPEDLEEATRERISSLVLGDITSRAQFAAA